MLLESLLMDKIDFLSILDIPMAIKYHFKSVDRFNRKDKKYCSYGDHPQKTLYFPRE